MTLEPGTRVRMTVELKRTLRKNGSWRHVDAFGQSIGVVQGLTDYGNEIKGPEVDVRWKPWNLRYAYHPDHLEIVE